MAADFSRLCSSCYAKQSGTGAFIGSSSSLSDDESGESVQRYKQLAQDDLSPIRPESANPGESQASVGVAAKHLRILRDEQEHAEMGLFDMRIDLLRLREQNLRSLSALVEAERKLYQEDEDKVSACNLSLKLLSEGSTYIEAVAKTLPTSAMAPMEEFMNASSITASVGNKAKEIAEKVRNLLSALRTGAELERRSMEISRRLSIADSFQHQICSADDEMVGEPCMICLEEFSVGDSIRTTPCNHTFHSACLKRWMGVKLACPLCQTDWSSDEKK